MKARRRFWLGVMLVLGCLPGWALPPKTAQDILADAANRAAAEHKILFSSSALRGVHNAAVWKLS